MAGSGSRVRPVAEERQNRRGARASSCRHDVRRAASALAASREGRGVPAPASQTLLDDVAASAGRSSSSRRTAARRRAVAEVGVERERVVGVADDQALRRLVEADLRADLPRHLVEREPPALGGSVRSSTPRALAHEDLDHRRRRRRARCRRRTITVTSTSISVKPDSCARRRLTCWSTAPVHEVERVDPRASAAACRGAVERQPAGSSSRPPVALREAPVARRCDAAVVDADRVACRTGSPGSGSVRSS